MARNRPLQRFFIFWQNLFGDVTRQFRRSVRRTRDSVKSSANAVRRNVADAPGSAGSGARRALRSVPEFFTGLWRALRRAPSSAADAMKGAARQAKGVTASVKTSVKGAQVQAQEQPGDLGRGMAGFWRRSKAFVWNRPIWLRVILLAILAGILTAPFTAKPAYRQLITWRAERLAERAEAMAAEGRDQEAFDTAQAAFLLNRRNPVTVDTVARLAQTINHPQTLEYLSLAIARPEPSPEIIALYVAEAIRRGNLSQARPYLSWLQQTQTDAPSTVALNIRYFMAEGQRDEALQEVREAVSEHPEDTEILNLYASLALDGSSPETTDEGLYFIRGHSTRGDVYGRTALRILLATNLISLSERAGYSRNLLAHPLAERDDKLLAFSSLLASKAVSYQEIESDILAQFDLTDGADLRDGARWLLLNGMPTESLRLVPAEKAKTNKELFQIYLTAMLESGRGQEVLDILASGEPVPLSPVERLIYQAGVQKALGLEESAETAAGLAIARAEVRDFSYLQRAIEYFDNDTLMLDFFRRVSRDPRFALLGKSRLFALAYELNRTDIIDSLVNELQLRDLRPYPQPQNTLAYVKLLRGDDIDEARRIAENLVARFPSLIDYRVTLALAYLQSNDAGAARGVLDPALAEREGFRNGWKVVVVALLKALGLNDEAGELASSIDRTALTTPEIDYLNRLGMAN